MGKRSAALLAALLALVTALTACVGISSGTSDAGEGAFTLTVRVPDAPDTLDPAQNTAEGGETILYHLFENLLRWEDDGSGWAVPAPGQAESWVVETDYAGNATYTFTLREGLLWSDGVPVTAQDFVDAWRRLADPANRLPYRELLADVAGYREVQETRDPSLLAVSAPDARTFVVSLSGSSATFLTEVCAGAHTMPVRSDLASRRGWGTNIRAMCTNGPYTVSELKGDKVVLARSETYYDQAAVGPDRLAFVPSEGSEADYAAFSEGGADLISALPAEALQALAADGRWTPEAVTEVYGVLVNTRRAPFDDPDVRLALLLAVDRQAAADALGSPTARPTPGLVPYGVADYCQRPRTPEGDGTDASSLPDPNAAPAPEPMPEPCWDFRAHSLERVTMPTAGDYDTNCQRARELLAQAGYPGGSGFPAVEYIYVDGGPDAAVAQSLQRMWQEQLGVTVSVRAVSREDYDAMLAPSTAPDGGDEAGEAAPADYFLAGQSFSADRWDAGGLLDLWHGGDNLSGYDSEAFDILMDSADAAESGEAWDAYLHDAEAILLRDAPVIPVFCQGGAYLLGDGLEGLFRAPDGVFFLGSVRRAQ